jgi:hypothetical protein
MEPRRLHAFEYSTPSVLLLLSLDFRAPLPFAPRDKHSGMEGIHLKNEKGDKCQIHTII